MFRDFLVGTFGKLLQVVLFVLGLVLVLAGLFFGHGGGVLYIVLGVISFCAAGGVRYAMGHIIRHRDTWR